MVSTNRCERRMELRKYLVDLREKHGMTQQDVANQIGISRQYYQMIENGDRQKKPDVSLLSRLAEVFGLTIGDIAEMETDNNVRTA